MERPSVSIVIPAWNAWHATKACLESLRPTLGVRDEVIVVDNGSRDETPRELANYSWVKVVTHEDNLGFAKGNNSGAAIAQNDILVFLNNDTLTPSRWIDELVAPFTDEAVGATGPMSNFVSGPQMVAGVSYEAQNSIAEFKKFARDFQVEHTGETTEIERLVGFCIAVRKTAFDQIGGWDERYGLGGFEDDDLCKALVQNDWKLLICHGSFVHHTGHVTFADNDLNFLDVQTENADKFAKKFGATALVSACMIMKDEAKYILNCIASARKFADEIVIYDTGSTDGSIEMARSAGAVVIEGYWDDDFSRARNEALKECHGDWILHLDADETLDVPNKKKALSYLKTPATPSALLIPITNHGDAVTGGRIGHQAVRLFRRADHKWQGRLHEQIIFRTGDVKIQAASFPYLHIDHYGYTKEALSERNKIERNVRLAQADVDDGTGDLAFKHMNLARSFAMGGRMEDALGELHTADEIAQKDGTTSDSVLRAIYRSAADYSLAVGRPEEALVWIEKLEPISERKSMSHYLRGQAYLNLGDTELALKEFDGITDVIDDEGLTYSEEEVHARRGLALTAAKKWQEASEEFKKAAEMGTSTAIWYPLVQSIQQSGGDVRDVAKLLPEETLTNALCQLFLAPPDVADEIIEAYLEDHPGNTTILAYSIRLAPNLELERALVWSDRLRSIGLDQHCPLIARANNESLVVKQRILAGAVAVACFKDERGSKVIGELGARIAESEFVNLIVQLNELAPATLKDFILGASSTPKRSMALARVLHELGAPEEALVVAEYGLGQQGAERAINDESREWVERLRAQVGSVSE